MPPRCPRCSSAAPIPSLVRPPFSRLLTDRSTCRQLLRPNFALRGKPLVKTSAVSVGKKARSYQLPTSGEGACEIVFDIDAKKANTVDIALSNVAGEKVLMKYNVADHTLSFDRTQSGIVDFSQDFPAVTVAPTFETDNKISLRFFIDRSSIEVFGSDGRFVMTNLVFPENPYTTLTLSAEGGKARIENLRVYPIKINQ